MQQYAHANVGDQIVVKGPNEIGAARYGAGSWLLAPCYLLERARMAPNLKSRSR